MAYSKPQIIETNTQGGIHHQQPKTNKALENKYLIGGTKADTYERPNSGLVSLCTAIH
jgi:hypothetical protein